ncbi:MAG: flagellar biosynthetic protein FliR [Labilithrix sp.]|nr:flagellar biosynthetic protein FliR [Labilithrix sp.]MCW5817163.1 flagellar biosynthetic protein FliR [Labilithrix sp.]
MDPLANIITAEAAALVLAIARLAGFVLVSPFPGKSTPTQVKVGLVLLLAWVVRAGQPYLPSLRLDGSLVGLVPCELGVGLLIGFTVRVTYSAAEILGSSFAQSTGLTMGAVFDPAMGTEDPVPARVMTLLAMLLFLACGAHRVALGYLLESFRVVPIGQTVDIGATAPSFVGFVSQAVEAGVRLSLPVMGVALVVQLALALVSRASPSLQVFSIGAGISVAAAVLTIMGAMDDTAAGLAAEMQNEAPRIEQVLGVATGTSP